MQIKNVDKKSKYKYYYNLNTDLNVELKKYFEYKKKYPKLKFIININLNNTKEDFVEIFNVLKLNGINPHEIKVNLVSKKLTFTQEEIEKINNLENYFKKLQIKFGLEDLENSFNASEIINANKKVKNMSNKIRINKLSPLEKLLETYLYVTYRKYTLENENEHYSLSRSLYGVFNTNKICCVGYSAMLAELIENIKDENIKIYENLVSTSIDNKNLYGYHENLIIHIKDEKYKLNGYYYLDPTFDAGHLDKYIPKLHYFLVPLCDIDKICSCKIRDFKAFKKSKQNNKTFNSNDRTPKRALRISNPKKRFDETYFSSDGYWFKTKFYDDFIKLYPNYFKKLKKECDLDEKSLKEKFVYKLNKDNGIFKFITKTSEPIDMHRLAFALKNVYKKENPNYTDEKLYSLIKKIMSYNCKTIKNCFKPNAKNCFVEYSKIFEKLEDFVL